MRDSKGYTLLEMLAVIWIAYIVLIILFGALFRLKPKPLLPKPSPYIHTSDMKPRALSAWKFCNPDYRYSEGEEILISKCPPLPQRYTDMRRARKGI